MEKNTQSDGEEEKRKKENVNFDREKRATLWTSAVTIVTPRDADWTVMMGKLSRVLFDFPWNPDRPTRNKNNISC